MKKSNITVLLDVDDTLLNIEGLKLYISDLVEAKFGKVASQDFWKIYEEVRIQKKFVDIAEIALRFEKQYKSDNQVSAGSILQQLPFEKFLIPTAGQLIAFLASNFRLIIFSDGDQLFQKTKIERLGLFDFADDIIISTSKIDLLPELLKKYKGVVIIDDKPQILKRAKELSPNCKTVWMKFGKHSDIDDDFQADYSADNLADIQDFLSQIDKVEARKLL